LHLTVFCTGRKKSLGLPMSETGARTLRKAQKNYSPQEKVQYLRRVLLEKSPLSTMCEEGGMAPTVYYRWQSKLFAEGWKLFDKNQGEAAQRGSVENQKIEALERKVRQREEALAELMAEHISLKKASGGL
jgi:transposase-like protein